MENEPKYLNEEYSFQERAEDLVSRMTVEECASQMLYESPKIERLGIPAYNWWNEALHGVARAGTATVFPQAIGLAATFDDALLYEVADVISTEARAKYRMFQEEGDPDIYKGLTFWSPNVNIFRDPRWGRGQETYGEDPYLTSVLGVAFVRGMQGSDSTYLKTATCAKHFAVHSGPERLRHEFNAEVSPQDLYETYLPAFHALVQAKVEGFMGAYNRTNGEPCCGSKTLLQELLREEWGFDGYVTSDCWAIADFHLHHKVTRTAVESVALAVKNGCDLNCGNLYGYVLAALKEGLITEEMIRRSVTRLMTTRMRLGLFDKHTPFDRISYDVVDCREHRRLNLEAARRSMVLLKNNGILPLRPSELKQIAVIGPNASSVTPLLGNYHGTPNEYVTILEGIRAKAGDNIRVTYAKGSHLYLPYIEEAKHAGDGLAEARAQAKRADVVVLAVGLDETIEGEEMQDQEMGGDKKDLLLPECQRELIHEVLETGTPVVLVNLSGSAIDFGEANEKAAAILQAWYPGAMGGMAAADILFGDFCPSGKLPVTFYHNEDPLPAFTDYTMEGRTYKFLRQPPLFPFGFGLSYTSFSYHLHIDRQRFRPGEKLTGQLRVRNEGTVSGEAVTELYLRDREASLRVPRHKLCGMRRVYLEPHEEKELMFAIEPEHLALVNEEGKAVYEPGEFLLFAGGCQPDAQSQGMMEETCACVSFILED